MYVAGWADQSPFTVFYERFRDDPEWTVHAPAGGHNLMRDAPADLLRILLS